jgi:16S rRNA (cytosine967-C5)-methyltransferase
LTPSARIAAAIDLLEIIEGAPKRPADAVANDFFRSHRYIGSGDRRAVSDRVWSILRARRRLGWWLGGAPHTARLLVAASLMLEGWTKAGVQQSFSGGQYAAPPLKGAESSVLTRMEGHSLDHPTMPDAIRLEVPDWLLPHLTARFGGSLPAEMAALSEPATLDMRVNLSRAARRWLPRGGKRN